MLILKVLKRKDGSSVVVAIVLALLLMTLLTSWSMELTNKITDSPGIYGSGGFSDGWRNVYFNPSVSALVQVVILEALLWVWVGLKSLPIPAMEKKVSKRKKVSRK